MVFGIVNTLKISLEFSKKNIHKVKDEESLVVVFYDILRVK